MNDKLDENIVIAIEKISQINRVNLWKIAKEEGISPIQIQFIDYISKMSLELTTISNLSMEFDLKKSTVSDSISNLINKGFLEKVIDEYDKRKFYLKLTEKSILKLELINERNKIIFDKLKDFSSEDKTIVLNLLMRLIKSLFNEGVVQSAKMCLTCKNFTENKDINSETLHFCNFLNIPMATRDLHFNCTSHKIN
jgi:DNA-binding MarR family transcriptional regulator